MIVFTPPIIKRPPVSEADVIILDTSVLVKNLRIALQQLKEIVDDEEYIMQIVIQELAFEKNAQVDLAYCCLETVQGYLGEAYVDKVKDAAEAINVFGEAVFKQLQEMKAYRNGYLFYQFMQMLGSDVMLSKLDPPKIHR